jgi:ferritin-like metal-binding protein YciE
MDLGLRRGRTCDASASSPKGRRSSRTSTTMLFASLVAAGQAAEHYEIARYGTLAA